MVDGTCSTTIDSSLLEKLTDLKRINKVLPHCGQHLIILYMCMCMRTRAHVSADLTACLDCVLYGGDADGAVVVFG